MNVEIWEIGKVRVDVRKYMMKEREADQLSKGRHRKGSVDDGKGNRKERESRLISYGKVETFGREKGWNKGQKEDWDGRERRAASYVNVGTVGREKGKL